MSDFKLQVGDCVRYGEILMEVFKIASEDALLCEYKNIKAQKLYQRKPNWWAAKHLGDLELIERDGKPYKSERKFEEGGYYPVKSTSGERAIGVCIEGSFYTAKRKGLELIHGLLKIGKKIEIDWSELDEGDGKHD